MISKTKINSMYIENFRNLENVPIHIGEKITLIAGRNGTSKSTILGAIAQICSFEKNYTPTEEYELNYKTYYGSEFATEFTDHFRISKRFDTPDKKYSIKFQIDDAQENLNFSANLLGTKRGKDLRLVLRKSDSIISNKSRNITHPTIFLGLERLLPISKRTLEMIEHPDLSETEKEFLINSTRRIFTSNIKFENISSNEPVSGVKSTVVTGNQYDISSASSGEDNLGQILMSIISFKRLQKNWSDYRGGIFLIDEIDASLFPKAQIELFDILLKESKKLSLQIIFTTHSPTLIAYAIEKKDKCIKNKSTENDVKLNYLSNVTGKIECKTNYSLSDIIADLNLETVSEEKSFKINCYFEDLEAYFMARTLFSMQQRKKIKAMKDITLGSENYKTLIQKGVPEFSKNSIVVLDGDTKEIERMKNVIKLPSKMPPDQLLFNFLNNLEPDHRYWQNSQKFTKDVFLSKSNTIIEKMKFDKKLGKYVLSNEDSEKNCRTYFKNWFNYMYENFFQKKGLNPFILWKEKNEKETNIFRSQFDEAYLSVFNTNVYLK